MFGWVSVLRFLEQDKSNTFGAPKFFSKVSVLSRVAREGEKKMYSSRLKNLNFLRECRQEFSNHVKSCINLLICS